MGDPGSFLFDLPAQGRPQPHGILERWYPGVRDLWSRSTSSRIFDPILGIKAIVIHATAGVSSAGAMSVMKGGRASWHWLVPDENEPQHGGFVWACAPEARAAWHVRNDRSHARVNGGARRVNHWSLAVEIVNAQEGSADPYSEWQVEAAATIVRYCWAKYPNIETVVSHAALDPERRSDPGRHFDWMRFRDLVLTPSATEPVSDWKSEVAPVAELDAIRAETCCAPRSP